MKSLAIIIPCYNEEKRLNAGSLIDLLNDHTNCHIYFINDGSTDGTGTLLLNMKSAIPTRVHIVTLKKNSGKGEAVRKGIIAALNKSFEFLGFLDADLSTSTTEFMRLTQFLNDQNLVVFGSRIKKANTHIRRTLFRHLVGRCIATIIDWRFELGIYDTQCGAKLFRTSLLQEIIHKPFYTSWFFDVEIFIRLKKLNKNIYFHEEPLLKWEADKNSSLSIVSFPTVLKELITLISYY